MSRLITCRRWRELATADFASIDRSRALVVLALGSIEQHGPHLPVGTDALIVEAVVEGVIPRLTDVDCLFLPTLWVTKSKEHSAFGGPMIAEWRRTTIC